MVIYTQTWNVTNVMSRITFSRNKKDLAWYYSIKTFLRYFIKKSFESHPPVTTLLCECPSQCTSAYLVFVLSSTIWLVDPLTQDSNWTILFLTFCLDWKFSHLFLTKTFLKNARNDLRITTETQTDKGFTYITSLSRPKQNFFSYGLL